MKSFNEWLNNKGHQGEFHYTIDEMEVGGKLYSGEVAVDLPFSGSPNDLDYGYELVGFNNLEVFDDDGNTHPVNDPQVQQQIFLALQNDKHFQDKAHEAFLDIHEDRIGPEEFDL